MVINCFFSNIFHNIMNKKRVGYSFYIIHIIQGSCECLSYQHLVYMCMYVCICMYLCMYTCVCMCVDGRMDERNPKRADAIHLGGAGDERTSIWTRGWVQETRWSRPGDRGDVQN